MQAYKLYRFRYPKPLDEVKPRLDKIKPASEISPIFEDEKVNYLELKRTFTDIRFVESDIWGSRCLRMTCASLLNFPLNCEIGHSV